MIADLLLWLFIIAIRVASGADPQFWFCAF